MREGGAAADTPAKSRLSRICSFDAPMQIGCLCYSLDLGRRAEPVGGQNHGTLQILTLVMTQATLSHPSNIHFVQTDDNSSMILQNKRSQPVPITILKSPPICTAKTAKHNAESRQLNTTYSFHQKYENKHHCLSQNRVNSVKEMV